MNVTLLGKKKITSSKGKNIYVLYIARERDGVEGLETLSGFTTEDCFGRIKPSDFGHDFDMAIFFKNSYTNIYFKKGV